MKVEKEEKNIQMLESRLSMSKINFESNLEAMKEERDHYKLECDTKTI